MHKIQQEIRQQPEALQTLARFYAGEEGRSLLTSIPAASDPLFFGAGASHLAAESAALQCSRNGRAARAMETGDLVEMPAGLLEHYHPLVWISPRGNENEIKPLLERVDPKRLIVVTNNPESTIGRAAQVVLPLCAGEETLPDCRTYVNSLALLWMLVRAMCTLTDGSEKQQIDKIRKRVQLILDGSQAVVEPWQALMDEVGPILFLGRGEHSMSAQYNSMVLAQLAKRSTQCLSVDSFRQGFIELSEPGVGAVIFASSAAGMDTEYDLANELDGYGVNVLLTVDGKPRRLREPLPGAGGFDPVLSTILDAIPGQLWAADLVQRFLPDTDLNRSNKNLKRQ